MTKTIRLLKPRALATVAALALIPQGAAVAGQQPQTPQSAPHPSQPPRPEGITGNSADVATLESTLAALYDVISGPAGPRDWNRFRSLFAPDARLGPAVVNPDGTVTTRIGNVEDFVTRAGSFFKDNAFHEREISNKVERFGPIVHVFSTYESRHAASDAKPFDRGINSIQLYNDGTRWWVVTIFWASETEKNPIPKKYLPD